MQILDLDLDFFADDSEWVAAPRGKRVPENRLPIWEADRVREFLESQCGLSRDRPVRGHLFEEHHEAFYFWHDLIVQGSLTAPFDLVHVDAHSDMGYPYGWRYTLTRLLGTPVKERASRVLAGEPEEENDGLNQTNFLLYAVACRWVHRLTWVYPEHYRGGDMLKVYYADPDEPRSGIELKHLRLEDLNATPGDLSRVPVSAREPLVPFDPVMTEYFRANGSFDLVTLCRSPTFTPTSADILIPVIEEYIVQGEELVD